MAVRKQVKSSVITPSTSPDTKPRAIKKMSITKTSTPTAKKTVTPNLAPKTRTRSAKEQVPTAPKKTTKNPSSKKSSTVAKPVQAVIVPTNMSLRAVDKASAWNDFFDTALPRVMYYVSYTSAFSFIAVGAVLCASAFFVVPGSQSAQLHSVLTATSGTTANTNVAKSALNPVPSPGSFGPVITLLDQLPAELSTASRFALSTNEASGLTIEIESLKDAKKQVLPTEATSNTHYRFTIPADTLTAGEYVLRAFVKPSGSGHSFRLGSFTVPERKEQTQEQSTPQPRESVLVNSESATSTILATQRATSTQITSPLEVENLVDGTEDEIHSESEISEDVIIPVDVVSIPVTSAFSLDVPSQTVSGWVPIRITSPAEYENIELYLRPQQSLSERYLGRAIRNFDRWFYTFNSENIPQGRYTIVAKSSHQGKEVISSPVVITIENTIATLNTTARVEAASSTDARTFLTFEQTPPRDTVVDDDAARVVEEVMQNNSDKVNSLLERYAVALQTNDTTLLATIDRESIELQENLLLAPLTDSQTSDIATAIEQTLETRFTELKGRVKAFETIRVGRTETAIDTDGDGISDSDEVLVYGTDPGNPDTDGDGFTDGIEIMRGFNPSSSDPEALISYELPQTVVGLERSDVLRVTAVTPFIERGESKASSVLAEISGTGLPNTFVTIYIFSTLTIVTVKTDADGAFVYRFEKELEDGTHEIYVTFTDNTGAILAKSEPFSFIKQAEAFTPTNSGGIPLGEDASVPTIVASNSYNVVFGLGIISFGLILLMLGISIRPRSIVPAPDSV